MATLTLTVAASTDDAVSDGGSDVYQDSATTLNWGSSGGTTGNYGQGIRVLNVTLSGSDTINSAYVSLMKSGAVWNNNIWRLTAIDADNTPTFSSSDRPGARAIVSASIAAGSADENRADGTRYEFPRSGDTAQRTTLGAAVAAVLGRGGWSSGNALAIVNNSKQDASADTGFARTNFHSWDSSTTDSEPQLVIDYTAGGPETKTDDAPTSAAISVTLSGDAPTSTAVSLTLSGDVPATTAISVTPSGDATASAAISETHTGDATTDAAIAVTVAGDVPTSAVISIPVTSQFSRPVSDISSGTWLPSTGSDLFAMLDETTPDDGDYVFSPDVTGTPDVFEVALGAMDTPQAGDVTVRYRAMKSAADGDVVTLTAALYEGATLRETDTPRTLTETATTYTWTLAGATVAAISDWGGLRVRLSAEVGA